MTLWKAMLFDIALPLWCIICRQPCCTWLCEHVLCHYGGYAENEHDLKRIATQ